MAKIFAGSCWSALYGREVTLYVSLYLYVANVQPVIKDRRVHKTATRTKILSKSLSIQDWFGLWAEILYITDH